jgi:organic hydroperoxide reductase OsmC/OhrA
MAETARQNIPLRRQSFVFKTDIEMTGSRSCLLSSEERVPLDISSPPEFKGDIGVWTPEHMFIGAVEACLFLTFMYDAKKRRINVVSFESNADGTVEFLDGSYRISHIILRPSITVTSSAERDVVVNILHEAEKRCLISNSISAVVEVNPTIHLEQR